MNPGLQDEAPRRFDAWFEALERRHLADLTFQEVRKGVEALSARYVERRGAAISGALSTRGKRAAFAMYYGPLHFLTVRAILRDQAIRPASRRIFDLGCGTGVAGAAWALEAPAKSSVAAFDLNAWALDEARWNFRRMGIRGSASRRAILDVDLSRASAVVAAFTVNELPEEDRHVLLERLVEAAGRGTAVLVVEPIARRVTPWWTEWAAELGRAGGRSAEWRFPSGLPDRLRLMDKAAGLDHRTLTARSILVPPPEDARQACVDRGRGPGVR